jgi:hypothetical protein
MQMNAYPLEHVFARLHVHGLSDIHVVLTHESAFQSALIVGARPLPAANDGST